MKRYLLALPPLLLITVWVMLLLADKGLAVASDRCQAACEQALRDAGVSLRDAGQLRKYLSGSLGDEPSG